MPIFGVGKVYRIWTRKGGPPQYRQSALQLPYMGTISHITTMHCKSTSIVVLLTISMQYDDWKSSTERTLRVPECCYRAVLFTLDHVSLFLFHCGSFLTTLL